ncbi:tyrosine-type recombinase/integrase [Geodermatophilus normandii]|uniref:tyrosine-type recombinase/integrase n=1 Tax=Geodermatophilus normandii TaxID=1137989 RepID=UPI001954ECC6|nr:tyrosine-type recombinase/integrase [Geodermatophilus normandii]
MHCGHRRDAWCVVHLGDRGGGVGGPAQGGGPPEDFRFHDLRHVSASLLIVSGLDAKTVQHRLRHGSATMTLDTYGHLWPGRGHEVRRRGGAALPLGNPRSSVLEADREHEKGR